MDLHPGEEFRRDGASFEEGGEGELVARDSTRTHLDEGPEGVAAEGVAGEGRDEGGEGDVIWVGNFIEQVTGVGGEAALGVRVDELVAEFRVGEEAGLEEAGVELGGGVRGRQEGGERGR